MNTNYDYEATSFNTDDKYAEKNNSETTNDNEETAMNDEQVEEAAEGEEVVEDKIVEEEASKESKSKKDWKKMAVGAGGGVLLGVGSTLFMGMQNANADVKPIVPDVPHDHWTDGKVEVATGVNDDMSFGEAFAAAREEVGPGGVFEWRGNVYATYSKEEWDMMSPEDRAEFNDHFVWNHGNSDHSTAHSGHSHTAQTTVQETENVEIASTGTHASEGDDIDVISVDHTADNNNTANVAPQDIPGDDILVTPAEPEIEILGVVHDDNEGTNIGGMIVDGHEVVVVDLDGDMTFDVMAMDANGNGALDNNEIIDIHEGGLTVSDLGGFSNPTDDLMASNDAPDYTSDPIYEG